MQLLAKQSFRHITHKTCGLFSAAAVFVSSIKQQSKQTRKAGSGREAPAATEGHSFHAAAAASHSNQELLCGALASARPRGYLTSLGLMTWPSDQPLLHERNEHNSTMAWPHPMNANLAKWGHCRRWLSLALKNSSNQTSPSLILASICDHPKLVI